MIGAVIAVVLIAVVAFAAAAWFGMVFVAPRIDQAIERAAQREEPGDRAD